MHNDKTVLLPNKSLKHSAPKRLINPFMIIRYSENEKLRIANSLLISSLADLFAIRRRPKKRGKIYLGTRLNCFQSYIIERNKGMGTVKLIITHGKPHKGASSDTISRWVNEELQLAGIGISTFSVHSCYSSSISKAKVTGI